MMRVFPVDVANIVLSFAVEPRLRMREWVKKNFHRLRGFALSSNRNAIKYALQQPHKIELRTSEELVFGDYTVYSPWNTLARIPEAIEFLLANIEIVISKACRDFNRNEAAIDFLVKNPRYIYPDELSLNRAAVPYLKLNPHLINWRNLSQLDTAVNFLLENRSRIDWQTFSRNPSPRAVEYLRQHPHLIDWKFLSENPADGALSLLERNKERIDWNWLARNQSRRAVEILEAHRDKINWSFISENRFAIALLEDSQDKVDWEALGRNEAIFEQVELDFGAVNQ
jgi:hypothetical protein